MWLSPDFGLTLGYFGLLWVTLASLDRETHENSTIWKTSLTIFKHFLKALKKLTHINCQFSSSSWRSLLLLYVHFWMTQKRRSGNPFSFEIHRKCCRICYFPFYSPSQRSIGIEAGRVEELERFGVLLNLNVITFVKKSFLAKGNWVVFWAIDFLKSVIIIAFTFTVEERSDFKRRKAGEKKNESS